VEIVVRRIRAPLPGEAPVEIVERKGLGHPDSICDAVAEEFSLALSRFYRDRAGAILHHNVDKTLLAAGRATPRFGGGSVDAPMRLFLAGRATVAFDGVTVPLAELGEDAARRWLGQNLHAVDPHRHVEVSVLAGPGSGDLVRLFEARRGGHPALANDTSCGVGYAPLSEVERLVLAVERRLTSPAAREKLPALGEDVKVMGLRRGDRVELVIGCAMVDAALGTLSDYTEAREGAAALALETAERITSIPVDVRVNASDDLAAGRVFLTVTGTSAEAGDDGQAGRGNRVNGLIAPGRPMTLESVAGKNPITHVGKLYNLAASLTAERLASELPGVRGAECRLVSRIGRPLDEPALAEIALAGADPERDPELARQAESILADELSRLPRRSQELLRGELVLGCWPLRAPVTTPGES
jgi:S-adenosylmethionine synthetase